MKNTAIFRSVSMAFFIAVAFLPASQVSAQDSSAPFGAQSPLPSTVVAPTPGGTTAAAPEQTDQQRAAAEILKTYNASLDYISGKAASGNGFIVAMSGTNYLVTNARLAIALNDAAFKGPDGTAIRGAPSVAVGEDIFRIEAPAGGKPFDVMQDVDHNAGIGDAVMLLGNAGANGTVAPVIGKIVAIGPNLVEVDVPFDSTGNGSPIIHLKSGKVLGVATYQVAKSYETDADKKTKPPVISRFASRLDSVKTWQPVNWQSYYGQAVMMQNIRAISDDLDAYFHDFTENGHITPERHVTSLLKGQMEQSTKTGNLLQSGADNVTAKSLSFLKMACQSDINTAQRYMTYNYFQRALGSEAQSRAEMIKAFDQILKTIPQDLFGGTKWTVGPTNDQSIVEFTPDGNWTEHWRGKIGQGHWKPTSDAHMIEVTRGPEGSHDIIHYKISDDGTTCTRTEDSLVYKKANADPLAL